MLFFASSVQLNLNILYIIPLGESHIWLGSGIKCYASHIQNQNIDVTIKQQFRCKILFGKITHILDTEIRKMLVIGFDGNNAFSCIWFAANLHRAHYKWPTRGPIIPKEERIYETKSKRLLQGFWISRNLIYAAFVQTHVTNNLKR